MIDYDNKQQQWWAVQQSTLQQWINLARRWEDDLGNIIERIAAEKDLEHNVTFYLEDPVEEVQEFEYICENIEMEEEGNSDNDGDKQQQQNIQQTMQQSTWQQKMTNATNDDANEGQQQWTRTMKNDNRQQSTTKTNDNDKLQQ